jgi:hypothetical protein
MLLLAAIFLESSLLAYATYVLLGVLVVSRLLARSWIANLSASRRCEITTAEIGDKVPVTLTLRNTGSLPVPWVLAEDVLPRSALAERPPRLSVKGKRLAIALIKGGGEVTWRYTLECRQRGYYQIGPLVLESGDVFGLHRRFRVETAPHFLMVLPRVVALEGYELASRRPIGEVVLTHRLYEDPTRIAGVRPYEAGDPLNRVHWRATARTGQLHSKIYEPTTLAGATILLDFHEGAYPRGGEPYRSELAVTAAVSLANAVFEMGQQVGLVSNARDAADRIRREGWQLSSPLSPLGRGAGGEGPGVKQDLHGQCRLLDTGRTAPAATPSAVVILVGDEPSDAAPRGFGVHHIEVPIRGQHTRRAIGRVLIARRVLIAEPERQPGTGATLFSRKIGEPTFRNSTERPRSWDTDSETERVVQDIDDTTRD